MRTTTLIRSICAILLLAIAAIMLRWTPLSNNLSAPHATHSGGVVYAASIYHPNGIPAGYESPTPGSRAFGWWQLENFLKVETGQPPSAFAPDTAWGASSDWKTKADLCLEPGAPCNANKASFSSKFETEAFQNPKELLLGVQLDVTSPYIQQSVHYNSAASKFIVSQGLKDNATFQTLQHNHTAMNKFGDNSIILKEVWEPVQPGGIVHIFDKTKQNLIPLTTSANHTLGPTSGWQPVQIDESNQACIASSFDLVGPGSGATPTIPISCFVSVALTDGSGKQHQFVLVGLNYMRKAGDIWYWYTYWWSLHPQFTPERRFSLGGDANSFPGLQSWPFYNMDTTTADVSPGNSCFNPYLEGPGRNGVVSNCFRCHQFAAYGPHPSDSTLPTTGNSPAFVDPSTVKTYMRNNNAVTTDFVWTLVTHLIGQANR